MDSGTRAVLGSACNMTEVTARSGNILTLRRPVLLYVEPRYEHAVFAFYLYVSRSIFLLFLFSSEKIISGFPYNILNNLFGTNYAEVYF
jgi:hypothetical protein